MRCGNLKREDIAVEKTNRIDQGVGPLRRLHRRSERRRAAGVVSVGKNDQRLAAGLAGDPAGAGNDRVVERRALRAVLFHIQIQKRRSLSSSTWRSKRTRNAWSCGLAQDLVEKLLARAALLGEHGALAAAHIDQQAERQRLVGLRREVANGLRPAVFFEREIVFGKSPDQLSLFIANGDQDVDYVDAGGKGGLLSPRERADQPRRQTGRLRRDSDRATP